MLCSCDDNQKPIEDTPTLAPEVTQQLNDDGLPEKVIYNDDEGNLNYTVEYEYDEYGNTISEKTIKADGTLDSLVKYEYKKFGEDFKQTKKTIYLSEDKINYYITDYEYKEMTVDGKKEYLVISYKRYTGEDKLVEIYKYEYDSNGSLKACITEGPDGNLISKTEY